MITHIVTFKWKPEIPDGQVDSIIEGLSELPGIVDSIRSYACGPDVGAADGNFDFAVVGTFDDIDGWRAYIDHPDHQKVAVERIRPWIASRAAAQFES